MKADRLIVKRDGVRQKMAQIDHMIKQLDGLPKSVTRKFENFRDEFNEEMKALIDTAMIPADPREALDLLEQIDKTERLPPDLIKEIRALLRKEKRESKKGAKASKAKK